MVLQITMVLARMVSTLFMSPRNVLNLSKFDKTLHLPLVESVSATHPDQFDEVIIKKVAHRLVVKVLNAVLDEVVKTAEQLMLLSSGSSTTSGLNLRDKLHPANTLLHLISNARSISCFFRVI